MAAMEQQIVSEWMQQRIQAAATDLERALRKARLTERQMSDVATALQVYFAKVQELAAEEEKNKAAASSTVTAPRTGWTEEDLKPYLDAGVKRL
jgi:uncharacterized protein YacL (UPF0231 family)